jgi:uncharacterized membrane protein YeaQ/YmgE (transglycosylase-associated protein family)
VHVVNFTIQTLFLGAIVGVGVAWAADRLSYSVGFGRFWDSILSIIGAVAALWYAARIGVPAKIVMTVVGASLGSALLILLARLVVLYQNKPAARAAASTRTKTIAVD